jgi:hypothetical protein
LIDVRYTTNLAILPTAKTLRDWRPLADWRVCLYSLRVPKRRRLFHIFQSFQHQCRSWSLPSATTRSRSSMDSMERNGKSTYTPREPKKSNANSRPVIQRGEDQILETEHECHADPFSLLRIESQCVECEGDGEVCERDDGG